MEIEFRGKTIDMKRWAFGDKCTIQGKTYIICADTKFIGTCPDITKQIVASFVEVDPASVGMFTTRREKRDGKGKKIFGGDIVKAQMRFDDDPQILEVQWLGTGFYIEYDDGNTDYDVIPLSEFDGSIEVIGNVTDNPALMGGEVMSKKYRDEDNEYFKALGIKIESHKMYTEEAYNKLESQLAELQAEVRGLKDGFEKIEAEDWETIRQLRATLEKIKNASYPMHAKGVRKIAQQALNPKGAKCPLSDNDMKAAGEKLTELKDKWDKGDNDAVPEV